MDFCGTVSAFRTFGSCNSTVAVTYYGLPTHNTLLEPEQAKINFFLTFATLEKYRSKVSESYGYWCFK
jgi:hypothetical protein